MPKSLRIAIFAPHFAEYSLRLALDLAHTKNASILLVVERKNFFDECALPLIKRARENLKIVTFDAWSRKGRALATGFLPARIAAFRPHVVHVQEQPDKVPARVTWLLGLCFPIVLTIHDPTPHSGRDQEYAERVDAYRKRLRASASAFHVHGAYCRAQLVITLGADDLRPTFGTQHGIILIPDADQSLAPNIGRILMFGRMEGYKGLEVLLDASDLLHKRGICHRIVLAGRGPELDRLRARSESMVNVEIIDKFLTPNEATREFQRASIVVTPYLDATQSGVIAAAFGNGRPVIASAVGGLVDAVRDGTNGLLVEPAKADLLADRLARLILDSDLMARLSSGVKADAAGDFAWPTICNEIYQAYLRVRGRSGAAARVPARNLSESQERAR